MYDSVKGKIEGIKIDFIRFRYPFAEQIIVNEGIRLASILDIACMKLDAITGRGRKKDFCDLYYLLQYFFVRNSRLLSDSLLKNTL